MDLTTGLAILGALKTVIDLGEKVYRFGSTLLKKIETMEWKLPESLFTR